MPIAALPEYLQKQDFSMASPGMRFGMYLKLWGENHELKKIDWRTADRIWPRNKKKPKWEDADNKRSAIDHACKLSSHDEAALVALNHRQQALAKSVRDVFFFPAKSAAPFTTGLGNEHPLENGFAFLWPYGLPYLPGSGVKGVLRQTVREITKGMWDESTWNSETVAEVKINKKPVQLTALDLLFGLESEDGKQVHYRGVLSFWDVIPEIKGNQLMVEIMTAHQSHYHANSKPPHDSGQPNPISFLTVPPDSSFNFHVQCDLPRLQQLAPSLAENGQWQTLLQTAFEHAFDWLGFGAKTAVGYGAMRVDQSREEERREQAEKEAARRRREAELASMPPVERDIVEIMERGGDNPPVALFQKLEEGKWKDPDDCRCVAEKIRELWQQEGKWNPGFSGTNKKKAKQKERCLAVLRHLEGGDG